MSGSIIKTPLDTDLYKFTMQQAMLHQYPEADAVARFKCRCGFDLKPFLHEIRDEIEALTELTFREDELRYLKQLRYIKKDYVDFLRLFRLNPKHVKVFIEDGQLAVTIHGPWVHITHFEIYILAIISEVVSRNMHADVDYNEGRRRLYEKIRLIKQAANKMDLSGFSLADFGTRRRFSREWQFEVVDILKHELGEYLVGTSNVDFARELELIPIGTMAHEWLQAHQALGVRLIDSQKAALDSWVKEYRGDLGIALTDVISMDAFLSDFDMYFAKLFDGIRHDSGDPVTWGEKAIAHYDRLGVNAKSKTLIFSDSLDIPKALEIYQHFSNRINVSFGIGTNLTNDLGFKSLNIVIKMVECNGQPVAKLSDSPGKTMCQDATYVEYLKQVFRYRGATV